MTVIFHQAAGIKTPTKSSTDPFKIRVSNNGVDPGAAEDVRVNAVTPAIVVLSSTSDPRDNPVTALAKGFDRVEGAAAASGDRPEGVQCSNNNEGAYAISASRAWFRPW